MSDKDKKSSASSENGDSGNKPEKISKELLSRKGSSDEAPSQGESNKYSELEDKLLKLFDKIDVNQDQEPGSSETRKPPRTIGDFKIIREIGRGGMGAVYEAEQISLRRKVALKILPSHLSLSDEAVFKFKREAEAGGRQSHPGIVAIHTVGEHEGVHFITQELVPGGRTLTDLLDELRNKAEQPPGYFRKAAQMILKVSSALQHAHDAGVIHRDIKPSNILLTEEGAPKVTDFGLAKVEDALSLSRTGDFSGTPYYMSPEQAMGRRMGIDKRTDIYSLGVTLYEMLTLSRPFEGKTSQDVLKKIMLVDPEIPYKVNPHVPRDLSVICLKAIEKMPDKRYATMTAFAEDLERFLNGDVILAKPAGLGTRLWKRVKRNPVVSASMGIAMAAVIVFAVVIPWIMYMNEQALTQKEKENAALLTIERDKAIVAREETEEQRKLAETERDRALAAEKKAEERYKQIMRLSDLKRLSHLEADADALWPAYPENIPGFEEWLTRADEVLGRLDKHQQTLSSLRETALPYNEEGILTDSNTLQEVDAQISKPEETGAKQRNWTFEDLETKWQHDMVAELVSGLKTLAHEEEGLVKSVRDRLAFATTIKAKSIADHQATWDKAITSIADKEQCPQYNGLVIEPMIGFVPIDRDPESGLWEFAHLQTGEIPERGPDGKLALTEEMGLVFVLIPGGVFNMGAIPPSQDNPIGAPNTDPEARLEEGPVHEVTIKPFFLSKYEMTQGQWLRFTKKKPSLYGSELNIGGHQLNLRHPVENVSWNECAEVLFRLKLRLPAESEWEYAARAGTSTIFFTGEKKGSLQGMANIADQYLKNNGGENFQCEQGLNDGYAVHAPVGMFLPNVFGLHDVQGNIFEWCEDVYAESYENTPIDGSANKMGALTRAVRGGSWRSMGFHCRSAYRGRNDVNHRYDVLGLRPAINCH